MYEYVNVGVKLPKKIVKEIDEEASERRVDRSTVIRQAVIEEARRYRVEKAVQAYVEKEVSLSKAAEMAGVDYREFAKILSQKGYRFDVETSEAKRLAKELEKILA